MQLGSWSDLRVGRTTSAPWWKDLLFGLLGVSLAIRAVMALPDSAGWQMVGTIAMLVCGASVTFQMADAASWKFRHRR